MFGWTLPVLLMLCCNIALAQHAPLTTQQWREDLQLLARTMPVRHRNLFHTMSKSGFEAAVAHLDTRLPELSRHQIIVEMAKIVAMAGDGHTNIAPTRDPRIGFLAFPVAMYFFDDGLYIRAADERYKELVSAKVLKIGRATVPEAYAAVSTIIGRDNPQNVLFFAPHLLVMPEVLHALGMTDDTESATLLLEKDGKTSTVKLEKPGPAEMMPPDTDLSFMPKPGWVDARLSTPLWLKDANSKFRYAYIDDQRLLYVQLNQIGDEKNESLKDFAQRVSRFIGQHPVEKLVLDLRLNRGGNGDLNPPVVVALLKAAQLDRPGRLFIIIGRSTYSAAQFLVNDVERFSQAIFVGEPSAGKPNSYGDSRKIVLPHSGITVRVSTLWWQVDERDKRQWTAPRLAADMRFEEYRLGIDPALTAIQHYRPTPSLAESLLGSSADANDVKDRYLAWRQQPMNRYADIQNDLHQAGYAFLNRDKHHEALAVFALWTTLYPDEANAYDSLGEAYLALKDTEKAVASYERALQLDPAFTSAAEALNRLKAQK
jgi:hypothetical protein